MLRDVEEDPKLDQPFSFTNFDDRKAMDYIINTGHTGDPAAPCVMKEVYIGRTTSSLLYILVDIQENPVLINIILLIEGHVSARFVVLVGHDTRGHVSTVT